MFNILLSVLEQSFIFGILALGSYISYTILNFPDLSVEGTFPLGAAAAAVLITNGANPIIALGAAALLGAAAGAVTGIIHVKLGIINLLAGIIVLTGLYSVNLILTGRSNLAIFDKETIFGFASLGVYSKVFIAFIIFIFIKIMMDMYLQTRSGFLLRAAGDNPSFVAALGKNVGVTQIIGLAIANGLAAFSGGLWCQYQRYFDVGMGKGMIVLGLAAVIIGISAFKNFNKVKATTAVLFGCVIYNACVAAAIAFGVNTDYMNLFIAALFLVTLVQSGRDGAHRKFATWARLKEGNKDAKN